MQLRFYEIILRPINKKNISLSQKSNSIFGGELLSKFIDSQKIHREKLEFTQNSGWSPTVDCELFAPCKQIKSKSSGTNYRL